MTLAGSGFNLAGAAEDLLQLLASKLENTVNIARDKEPMDEPTTWYGVPHAILGECTAVAGLEQVLMNPQPVRPSPLFVYETMGRIPGRDFSSPPNRQTAQSQSIIDERSRPQDNWVWCEDGQFQPKRSERLQVMASLKKEKTFSAGLASQSSHRYSKGRMVCFEARQNCSKN